MRNEDFIDGSQCQIYTFQSGCVQPAVPVSYTHLDVYKRQDKLTAVVIDLHHLFHTLQPQHIPVGNPVCLKDLIGFCLLVDTSIGPVSYTHLSLPAPCWPNPKMPQNRYLTGRESLISRRPATRLSKSIRWFPSMCAWANPLICW